MRDEELARGSDCERPTQLEDDFFPCWVSFIYRWLPFWIGTEQWAHNHRNSLALKLAFSRPRGNMFYVNGINMRHLTQNLRTQISFCVVLSLVDNRCSLR